MVARAPTSKVRGRTGIAISAMGLCAADVRLRDASDRTWRAPLDPPPTDGTAWPSLTIALTDLARAVGASDDELSISLMPPLTEVRQLELPPLGAVELQRVLSRDAARYFVNGRTPQIVGASLPRGSRRAKGPVSVVASAASQRLVTSIRAAAAKAGWTLTAMSPAETSWAAAAVALWPAFAKQSAYVLVAHDDRTDLLQLDNGRLVGVRRFRAGASDAAMIADTIGPSARVGIVGALSPRKELSTGLSSSRITVQSPSGELANLASDAEVLAAHYAGSDAGPVLRTDDAIALERAHGRKATWTFGGIAAALLIASAAVEMYGTHRQLDQVRAQRAAIKPQLSATLVGRTTVAATYAQLAALDSIERAAPQWASVIETLTESVPSEAHLTAIRAHQDSLIVDGLAVRAKPIFDALEATRGLADVRAASPVRRELQDSGAAMEHFTIGARVLPASVLTPPLAPAANRPGEKR